MRECTAQNMRLRLMASIDRMGELVFFKVGHFKFTTLVFSIKQITITDPRPLTLDNEWLVFSYQTLFPP